MTRQPPTFYVLHGDDEFSRKAEVQKFRARMGEAGMAELNTEVFDGKSVSAEKIISAANTLPFLSDKRLVIVEGMLTWLGRKGGGKTAKAELDLLLKELPNLGDTARLVFVEPETLDDKHPILQLVNHTPRGFAKAFNPPRDPTSWIMHQVEQYGGKIDPRAAAGLAAVTGSDLRAADSECIKLVTYAGPERTITEADVRTLTSYVPETDIFKIVDAMGRGDSKLALKLIYRLLEDPKEEPLRILSMITRQFRLLLQTREILDSAGDTRDLPKLLGINPYAARDLVPQARNFTLEQLEQIYRYLLDTDHAIKTGRVKDTLALDLLVASLSR